ncbi:nitrate- and nitrite sensing domain-containing protein [Streptomyces sp. TLI_146]|uniref:nitrate- and nitrite sensing domain-containing protein n=1 Tax=Streptomyces sp. TLI_146 TaxID=1938858 RepID=UPI000C706FBC|nr:nitrate- and nitrite sensing domain-containing protein [Streptomyces sp. TLI_146]PKV89246.1 signal transduction histidine kinase [Streptomyces sp. TLI_146]
MRTPRKAPGAAPGPLPPAPSPARGRRAHAGPPAAEYDSAEAGRGEGPGAYERAFRARPESGQPGEPVESGLRGRLRPTTVRAKIVSLLMVPVVSLLALWGFATVTTAQDVSALRQLRRIDEQVRTPVAAAVAELQAERRSAVRYLAAPADDRAAAFTQQAKRTDGALAQLRLGDKNTVADEGDLPGGAADRLRQFVSRAQQLPALRASALGRKAGWDTVYQQYTDTIALASDVTGALTGLKDGSLGSDARVVHEFSRAAEMLAREDALLSSAQLARTFSFAHHTAFAGAVDSRRTLTDAATADLSGAEHDAWRTLSGQPAYTALRAAEDKVLAAAPGRDAAQAVPEASWDDALTAVQKGMRDIESGAARDVVGRADPFARGLLTPAGSAVLFGLVAVAASLVISVRIGRGLVVELVSLRNTALEIARRKLPAAMGRLRAGEDLDVEAEAPQGPVSEDEIGQVGEALGTVHRAALAAAVERAELASGISGVFVNLARRSQVLVHRQLNLLDSMERRAEDPGELGDLFRLDHLTTRMRRHAESLIILSGAAPGRAWSVPVPLTSVVRAAVSEVEDYARVEVRQLPEAAVTGGAVADLTHLLAELVENAAQFSPPHTKVRVSGEPVGNGYALEIEDRGLGMGRESLDEANHRIEHSEAVHLFDTDRLGLFVVSRLAARHGIKVQLRTSPYGGTTAVVLLPTGLLDSAITAVARQTTRSGLDTERVPLARSAERDGRAPTAVRGKGRRPLAPAPGLRPEPADDDHLESPSRTESTASIAVRPTLVAPVETPSTRATTAPATVPTSPPGVATLRQRARTVAPDSAHGDGLPRRVRQASLAPQLREAPAEQPPTEESADTRTPEQVRDRMTAYMGGWARGGASHAGAAQDTAIRVPEADADTDRTTSGPSAAEDACGGDQPSEGDHA